MNQNDTLFIDPMTAFSMAVDLQKVINAQRQQITILQVENQELRDENERLKPKEEEQKSG